MKYILQILLISMTPLLAHSTRISQPVIITGKYTVQSTDPRYDQETFYKFEIKLDKTNLDKKGGDKKGEYIGTLERPVVEYLTNGERTSEIVTTLIEVIKGVWLLDMGVVIVEFPHVQDLKDINAKSNRNFDVQLRTKI